MENSNQEDQEIGRTISRVLPPLAPLLMITFWMLLGGAAGIKVLQTLWNILGWNVGNVSIAVPVGGAIGAIVGAVLGRISTPRLLVLLMAVFAGSAAGGVAGEIAWGQIGEIGGQVVGGSIGGARLSHLAVRGPRAASPHLSSRQTPIGERDLPPPRNPTR